MEIESVKLLKTLKAGPKTWNKGTIFPNRNCPLIPKEILGEVALGKPTVEVLSEKPEDRGRTVFKPKFLDEPEAETNVTVNVESSLVNVEVDPPESDPKPEPDPKPAKAPKPRKKKSSLVKRKS